MPGFRTAGSAGQLGMFAELAPAVVPDLLALADDARPHLLLREPYEFAAWLAAERSGLPMVVHAIGVVTGSPVLFAAVAGESLAAARTAAARTAAGLPADPDLRSLYGRGIITFYPSSLRFLQLPPPDVPQQLIRLPSPGPARLPFERVRPGRPLVYVTLGTVFNTAVDLLRTLVAGVAALDAGGGRRRRVPRQGGDGLRRPLGRGAAGGRTLGRRPADLRHGLRACGCRGVPGARPATAGVPGLRD